MRASFLPVAIIGPAVGVVRGTRGPALPAPLGILGKALRNASGQELVAVYFKFNHLLQVAPLPRDASREEVVLNVDFPWCQKREKEEREKERERGACVSAEEEALRGRLRGCA